ncbi:MAG: internal scaffolding protein [Microvirus sp.]|nr:MAG: internal scaffolding protein [Microvirus sp.]
MNKMYHYYNAPVSKATVNKEPSRTHQEYRDECDLNKIMDKYRHTGVLPAARLGVTPAQPRYGDFRGVDYHAAQTIIADANQRFEALPAVVRDRFRNEPVNMIKFLQDSNNRAEAEKLGLVNPAPKAPAEPVEPKTQKIDAPASKKGVKPAKSPAGAVNSENPEGE